MFKKVFKQKFGLFLDASNDFFVFSILAEGGAFFYFLIIKISYKKIKIKEEVYEIK